MRYGYCRRVYIGTTFKALSATATAAAAAAAAQNATAGQVEGRRTRTVLAAGRKEWD